MPSDEVSYRKVYKTFIAVLVPLWYTDSILIEKKEEFLWAININSTMHWKRDLP